MTSQFKQSTCRTSGVGGNSRMADHRGSGHRSSRSRPRKEAEGDEKEDDGEQPASSLGRNQGTAYEGMYGTHPPKVEDEEERRERRRLKRERRDRERPKDRSGTAKYSANERGSHTPRAERTEVRLRFRGSPPSVLRHRARRAIRPSRLHVIAASLGKHRCPPPAGQRHRTLHPCRTETFTPPTPGSMPPQAWRVCPPGPLGVNGAPVG